ncbi:hypothetical protein ACFWWT_29425 [Streptomyces sp. NPDC058676]|uniref:hypothetical protein n=1 Tax=unclassified Streptomyces TaxID=2593676 RepID=UPI0036537DFB
MENPDGFLRNPSGDQVHGPHPLERNHAADVHRLTGMTLDLDRFEYFLEVEAD